MRISKVVPESNWRLLIISDDGRTGHFDVSGYLQYEAFEKLKNIYKH